ncbi:MAG: hypothetical protein EOP48_32985, partial [Sphingobacteriales bacterium]
MLTQAAVSQQIAVVTSTAGSVISLGKSLFVMSGLASKIVMNTRYLDFLATTELAEVYKTFKTDLFSWDFPGSLNYLIQFKLLSEFFAKYDLDPPFIVNFWSNMMIIGVGLCALLITSLLRILCRKADDKGIFYGITNKLCGISWNFTLMQVYGALDDILFYIILDFKTNPFNTVFSWFSFLLATIFTF